MSITAMKQALAFLQRVTHWEEGKPDLHDVKTTLRTAIAEAEKVEPVGSVTVSPWRGLENIEWQQQADIPEGTHMLYLAAPQAQPAPKQELVVWDVEESVLAIHRILKSAASFSTKEGALRSELKSVFQAGKAQPAPEQDQCWCDATGIGEPGVSCGDCPKDYAAPVQAQERKPLTDEEIKEATGSSDVYWSNSKLFIIAIFRAAEAAHGINE